MVALAYIVTWEDQPTPPAKAGLNDQQLALTTSQVVELVEVTDGSRLQDLGAKLSAPLENELKLALNDARTAVDFLTKSFLPSGFEARLPTDVAVDKQ